MSVTPTIGKTVEKQNGKYTTCVLFICGSENRSLKEMKNLLCLKWVCVCVFSLTNSSSVPYHYYESNRLDECGMYRVHERVQRGGHRFITEKQIYRRWASKGKLKFQYPAWWIEQEPRHLYAEEDHASFLRRL